MTGPGGAPDAAAPVLHQFLASHFNEKARWGLDWKGLPHRRVCYLPGPHVPFVRRMTGQSQLPVLEIGDERVPGSARILERLDALVPERPLHPADPEQRRAALALQAEWDEQVGPAVRTAFFSIAIQEPGLVCRIFSRHRGPLGRAAYRVGFPLARGRLAHAHGLDDPGRVERCFGTVRDALDRLASRINAHGQLVGEGFCVADLTCAALLAPLAPPDHPDMALPGPLPGRVRAFHARWVEHPAMRWVHEQYTRHRPASAAREPRGPRTP